MANPDLTNPSLPQADGSSLPAASGVPLPPAGEGGTRASPSDADARPDEPAGGEARCESRASGRATWNDWHQRSEALAAAADWAVRSRRPEAAVALYTRAAEVEERALERLDATKRRTRGITAVGAVALWFKARQFGRAEQLARALLAKDDLPAFAVAALRQIVDAIRFTEER